MRGWIDERKEGYSPDRSWTWLHRRRQSFRQRKNESAIYQNRGRWENCSRIRSITISHHLRARFPRLLQQRIIREELNRDWIGLGARHKYFRLVYEAHAQARARACAMLVKRCAITAGWLSIHKLREPVDPQTGEGERERESEGECRSTPTQVG